MAEKKHVTVEMHSALACRSEAPDQVHRVLMTAEVDFPDVRVADFPDWFMERTIQVFGEKVLRALQREWEAFAGMLAVQAGLLEGQEPEEAARIWEGARRKIAEQPVPERTSISRMDMR